MSVRPFSMVIIGLVMKACIYLREQLVMPDCLAITDTEGYIFTDPDEGLCLLYLLSFFLLGVTFHASEYRLNEQ